MTIVPGDFPYSMAAQAAHPPYPKTAAYPPKPQKSPHHWSALWLPGEYWPSRLSTCQHIWLSGSGFCLGVDRTLRWWVNDNRKKFRHQTSDNMDRWKAEMGRVREEKRRRKEKKIQVREKVGKSRNTVFFHWFVAPEGRKVGCRLAKAAGAEPAGQMRDEKLHAIVAGSTYPSQNVQNTSASDHFPKLRCQKKCTPLWREAHFQVRI